MDKAYSGIDWKGLEQYFVEHTPADMSLRDFADNVTHNLPAANHTAIHYGVIKDEAKTNYWMRKRAKHLVEKNPGLRADTEVIYGLIKARLIDGGGELTATEFTRLANILADYQEILKTGEALIPETSQEQRMTRDDFLTIVREEVETDKRSMFVMAQEMMHAETPV